MKQTYCFFSSLAHKMLTTASVRAKLLTIVALCLFSVGNAWGEIIYAHDGEKASGQQNTTVTVTGYKKNPTAINGNPQPSLGLTAAQYATITISKLNLTEYENVTLVFDYKLGKASGQYTSLTVTQYDASNSSLNVDKITGTAQTFHTSSAISISSQCTKITIRCNPVGNNTYNTFVDNIKIEGEAEKPAEPSVTFYPKVLTFGEVEVGNSKAMDLTIKPSNLKHGYTYSPSNNNNNEYELLLSTYEEWKDYSSSKEITVTFTPKVAVDVEDEINVYYGGKTLGSVKVTGTGFVSCTRPKFTIDDQTISLTDASALYDLSNLSINTGESNGSITYSSTNENCVVENGTFYAIDPGTYEITATMDASSDGKYCEATTTFTIIVEDSPADCKKPNFFPKDAISISLSDIGDDGYDFSANIKKGDYTGDIDYYSDDDNATIDGTKFVVVDGGSYTINALISGDDTYCKDNDASFTINVYELDKPQNVIVTNTTQTTATLQWDPVADAESYTIIYIAPEVTGEAGSYEIAGITDIPYTIEGLEPDYIYVAIVKAIGKGGSYGSSPESKTVDIQTLPYAPVFKTQPVEATYFVGKTAKDLVVEATDATNKISYQWYQASAEDADGTLITGATAASYTPSTATVGTTYYYCVATNAGGSTRSETVAITVKAIPTLVAVSNDETWGTVTTTGNTSGSSTITATPAAGYRLANPAYTITEGTAKVTQKDNDNEFTIIFTDDCKITINFEPIPMRTLTYYVGNDPNTRDVPVGAKLSDYLPTEDLTSCDDNSTTFIGWTATPINGKQDDCPELIAKDGTITMDTTVYAVFAKAETTGGGETKSLYMFADMDGFANWPTDYLIHTHTFTDGAYLELAKANKQSIIITNMPVTKKNDVIFKAPNNNKISALTFTCKKWNTNNQTITLHTSTDGENYTQTSTTSSNFTLTATGLTNVVAVKFTFSADKQIGLESLAVTYGTQSTTTYTDYITTCEECTNLATPEISSVEPSTQSVNITWNAIKDADSYKLEYKYTDAKEVIDTKDITATDVDVAVAGGKWTYTLKELEHNTKYSVRLRAIPDTDAEALCESDWSDEEKFTTNPIRCTITWLVNGKRHATTEEIKGQTITTLPEPPADDVLDGCGVNTFVGWSANPLTDELDNSALEDLFKDAAPTTIVESDKEYHAVFAQKVTSSDTYDAQKITSNSDIVGDTKYIIKFHGNYVARGIQVVNNAVQSTNEYQLQGLEGTEDYIWTFKGTNRQNMTIYNYLGTQTLNNKTKSTSLAVSNSTTNLTSWTVEYIEETQEWKIYNTNTNDERFLGSNTPEINTLKAYQTTAWNTYKSNIQLYKLVPATSYTNYLTHCVPCTKLEVTWSEMQATDVEHTTATLSWNVSSTDHITGYEVQVWNKDKTYDETFTIEDVSKTTLNLTDLSSGTTYYWTVTALTNKEYNYCSTSSEEQTFTTTAAVKLKAPTNLQVTYNSDTDKYTFSWDAPENAPEGIKYKMTNAFTAKKPIQQTYSERTLDLIPGKEDYTATVQAIGDGIYYSNSDEISVSFTAYVYWLTLSVDNGNTTTKIQTPKYELPTATSECEALGGYTFAGWSEKEITEETTEAPTLYLAGTKYGPDNGYIKKNRTLYAVFTRVEAEEGAKANEYELVGTTDELISGDNCVIAADAVYEVYALTNTESDVVGSFVSEKVSVDENVIITTDASIIWKIEGDATNGYTFFNQAKGKYLDMYLDGTKSKLGLFDQPTNKWKVTITTNENNDVSSKITSTLDIKDYNVLSYYINYNVFNAFNKPNYDIYFYKSLSSTYYTTSPQCSEINVVEWKGNAIVLDVPEGQDAKNIAVTLQQLNEGKYVSIASGEVKADNDTISVPVATLKDLACQNIRITLKTTEGALIRSGINKVPIIVDGDMQTDRDAFRKEQLTDEVCATCDVVVRDGKTLSAAENGKRQFRNMYVYPNSQLNLQTGSMQLETLYMFAHNDDVSYAITNNGGDEEATVKIGEVRHVKCIDGHYWYPFSLPYSCQVKDIVTLCGKELGDYYKSETEPGTWGIKFYDGELRQTKGNSAGIGGVSPYWKFLTPDATLNAYQGYIIALFYQKEAEERWIEFVPAKGSMYTEDKESKSTTVQNWNVNPDADPSHHGWNFTGSPYISLFGNNKEGDGLNNSNLAMGKLGDEENEVKNVYVSIPNGGNSKTYTQVLASATQLKPFSAYFVQALDPKEGEEGVTLTYSKGARSLMEQEPTQASAPRRASEQQRIILAEINLTKMVDGEATALTDNAGVQMSDRFSDKYEIGYDLTKMYAAADKPQLYTKAGNEKLAYNALPDALAHDIPLGIYVPAAGEYRLSLHRSVSSLRDAAAVYVLHNGAVVADLLLGDYTLEATAKGEQAGYALDIRRASQVITGADESDSTAPYAICKDGKLVIGNMPTDAALRVYDVLGRLIWHQPHAATGVPVVIPTPQTGVYMVVVESAQQQYILKPLVR